LEFEEENPVLVQAAKDGLPVVIADPIVLLAADFYLRPPF
jgi:hypothetical protein